MRNAVSSPAKRRTAEADSPLLKLLNVGGSSLLLRRRGAVGSLAPWWRVSLLSSVCSLLLLPAVASLLTVLALSRTAIPAAAVLLGRRSAVGLLRRCAIRLLLLRRSVLIAVAAAASRGRIRGAWRAVSGGCCAA